MFNLNATDNQESLFKPGKVCKTIFSYKVDFKLDRCDDL